MKKNRFDLVCFFLGLVITICFVLLVLIYGHVKTEPENFTKYTVADGDTLWGIALRESNGGGRLDTRDIVSDILAANDLSDSIYPGQTIRVPQY